MTPVMSNALVVLFVDDDRDGIFQKGYFIYDTKDEEGDAAAKRAPLLCLLLWLEGWFGVWLSSSWGCYSWREGGNDASAALGSASVRKGNIEHQIHIKDEDRSDAINSNEGFICSEAIYEKMCLRL